MGQLLERERELDAIAELLAYARAGDARPLLFDGPPGIGKTALLTEACARADAERMLTLTARGADLERLFPFGCVRQLFERVVLRGPAESLLDGAAGLAAPVFGLARPARLLPPADDREAALIGLYWLLVALAESGPLVITVDDLQWADRASLEWLLYALPRIGGVRAGVVMASRPGDEAGGAEGRLLAAIADNADVVTPTPLGSDAAGTLLAEAAGTEMPPPVRDACVRATAGNPLLLHEVGRALAESGQPASALSVVDVERASSPRISRLVRSRLREVSEPAAELARAIATLGLDAELAHAAAITGMPVAEAALAADELRARGVLARVEGLAFAHPLVERTVYEDLPPGRRALWHARAAQLLAAASGTPERIAAHLLRSEPSGDANTVELLLAAGRDAMARGAPESAIAVLERALRERADHRDDEVLAELGRAEAALLLPDALTHLRRAYELAEPGDRRSAIALTLGRTMVAARLEDPSTVLKSIEELGADDPDLALRLEATLTTGLRMDPAWAATMSERTRRWADAVPGPTTDGARAILSCLAGEATLLGEDVDRAVGHAVAALADGRLLAAETSESAVFVFSCMALTSAGRFTLARAHLDAAHADARARGSQLGFAHAMTFRAEAALRAGDLRDAEADARAALDAMQGSRALVVGPLATAWLALALLEQGRADAARAAVAARAGDAAARSQAPFALVRYVRGLCALGERRPQRAVEDLAAAGRDLLAARCLTPTLLPWRSAAARAYAMLGDGDAARSRADEELELASATRSPEAIGIAVQALAAVGEPELRVERLRAAVEALERSEARLRHGRALCDLGTALRHAGAPRDAREPLRLALDAAERCGAAPLADRARSELLASGARPRRARVFGRDALTPAELRVAELAADGASNREIAQALFVTVKTVETQLGSGYRKLGVRSRRELAGALLAAASAESA